MEIYSVYDTASFEEVLDDLCVRFIVNLPEEELASRERVCFQIEEAHWFYEDFVREQNLSFPSLNLRTFLAKIFQHCPPLHKWGIYEDAYADFMLYKKRVPIRGAILLNEAMSHCILVKGWKQSSSWSFPRGKINKDEPDDQCAIREVMEETGFDITDLIDPSQFLVHENLGNNHMKLYIVPGVPEDTVFVPQSRKEISRVEWQALTELPSFSKRKGLNTSGINTGKLFMVVPFMPELRKWIAKRKRQRAKKSHGTVKSRVTIEETEPETSAVETSPPRQIGNHYIPDDSRNSQLLRTMLGIGGDQPPFMSVANEVIQPPLRVSTVSPQAAGANLLALLKSSGPNQGQQTIPAEEVISPRAEPQLSGRQISLSELFSSAPPKRNSGIQSHDSPPSTLSASRTNLLPGFAEHPTNAPHASAHNFTRTTLSSPVMGGYGPPPVQISHPTPHAPSYSQSATSTIPTRQSNQSSALLQMLKSTPTSPPSQPPSAYSDSLRQKEIPKTSILDSLIPTAPAKPPDSAHAVSLLEILRGAAPPPPSEPSVKALPLQSDFGLLAPPSRGPVIANGSGRATPVQPMSSVAQAEPNSVLIASSKQDSHTASLLATLRGGIPQKSPQATFAVPSSSSVQSNEKTPAPHSPAIIHPLPIEARNENIRTVPEVLAPASIPVNNSVSPTLSTKDLSGTFDRRKIVDNSQAQKLLDLFKTTPATTNATPVITTIATNSQPGPALAPENIAPKQAPAQPKRATAMTPNANDFLLGYLDEVAKKYGK